VTLLKKYLKFSKYLFIGFSFLVCHSSAALEIRKSQLDDRLYHYQELNNQIKVLLISDPGADKAAAALNVHVGSLDDPRERQGLAHFLEHMLFLGTEKYPEAGDYQQFISDHGGSHNAYTSSHNTNYYFDIDTNKLDEALDRFSQFFIAPLFDPIYVERERNAVHSEYQAKIQDDYRRAYDVYRHVINPNHPESKFNVGNITTLSDRPGSKIRNDLINFYKTQYSSDKMSLVVLGKQSINDLKSIVLSRFSQVSLRKKTGIETKNIALFQKHQLPFEVVSKPLKELRQMQMNFIVPSIKAHYKKKPLYYIGHLLGHEGEGSLLSLLKQKGLAESLSVSHSDKHDGSAEFNVVIQLTPDGQQKRELIRSLVFYVIDNIKNNGVDQWRYLEKSSLAQSAFNFQDKNSELRTVRHLASNLHYYPPEDVIVGDYLMEDFDAELIQDYLSYLQPKNLFVTSMFPEVEPNKTSTFYSTPYRVTKLSTRRSKLDKRWLKQLTLPGKNPFVPEDTALYEKDESLQFPLQLQASPLELWVSQDVDFKTPKAKVIFRIESPFVAGDLQGAAINTLYVELLQDQLNEYNYPALLAGASLWIQANHQGMEIVVTGYHDKLHHLMQLLMVRLEDNQFDPKRVEQIKTDLIRHWGNGNKSTPYRQLYNYLASNLNPYYWTDEQKIAALKKVSIRNLEAFAKKWRQGARVQGLFYGNLNKDWLEKWKPYTQNLVLPGDKLIQAVHIRKLTTGVGVEPSVAQADVSSIEHSDKAAILYVQGLNDQLEDRAMMALLRQIMGSPFYHQLRTQQQLGYIVFMGSLRLKQVPGSVFVVQSPSATIDTIQQAIENFLTVFYEELPNDLSLYQKALITQLLDAPESLSEGADKHWINIRLGNSAFNEREQLAEAVKNISASGLKNYYEKVFLNSTSHLWQLSESPEEAPFRQFIPNKAYYEYP
jgi:secreted Zn-dependent insulinase-like peptidase